MEYLTATNGKAPATTILTIAIKEELIPFESNLMAEYYVLGDRETRDKVLAAKIAGMDAIDSAYELLPLGGVPRGRTLNLVAQKYRRDTDKPRTFNAIAYRACDMDAMLTEYRQTHLEEPECLLAVKPKWANRIFVVKGSEYAHGCCMMGSGIPLSLYHGEYEETMLAIGRPLLYSEVEYLPLER